MKNPTQIKDFNLVLAGAYTRNNLKLSLRDPVIVSVHVLIKKVLDDIPCTAKNRRSQLEVREVTNPGAFIRMGNLFELSWFIRRFPKFPFDFGPIEGFDEYLEDFGKETGISLTVPVACFDINSPVITLERNDRRRISKYQLVVV